MTDNKL